MALFRLEFSRNSCLSNTSLQGNLACSLPVARSDDRRCVTKHLISLEPEGTTHAMCMSVQQQDKGQHAYESGRPPGLTSLPHADCPPPQGKLLPQAEVHKVWLVMQLLKNDVLPLPLMKWREFCLQDNAWNAVLQAGKVCNPVAECLTC